MCPFLKIEEIGPGCGGKLAQGQGPAFQLSLDLGRPVEVFTFLLQESVGGEAFVGAGSTWLFPQYLFASFLFCLATLPPCL